MKRVLKNESKNIRIELKETLSFTLCNKILNTIYRNTISEVVFAIKYKLIKLKKVLL